MSKVEVAEAFDPANPPAGWVLVSENAWSRRWEYDNGDGTVFAKTEYLHTEKMLDDIAAVRNNNAGKRWGDGQVVGSIPLNLYYSSGMAEASRQRDTHFIRKFYRDHPKLKKFDGDL